MKAEIILKNYRCFPVSSPLRFEIKKGFTSFVGTNNSGKSTVLKSFFEFRNLFGELASPNYYKQMNTKRAGLPSIQGVGDPYEIFCNQNKFDLEILFKLQPENEVDTLPLDTTIEIKLKTTKENSFTETSLFVNGHRAIDGITIHDPVLDINKIGSFNFDGVCTFFRNLHNSFYVGPFRNAINIGTMQQYFDIDIGQAFVKQWKTWKTGDTKIYNRKILDLTESLRKLLGFNQLEISPSPDETTFQFVIDGQPYRLAEIGSGISQFVVVLAQAAMKEPSFILIDEPESNLHASLQLDFLTTLASYASEGVLFATHNLGLARAASDQIYSIQRVSEGNSKISIYEATPRLSELAGELSFAGYKELGFEKILLVEGKTDIKTILQFLRLYNQELKVVMLSLAGRNLINGSDDTFLQLQEITRITSNVSALIDSEKTSEGEELETIRKQFMEICDGLNIECKVLERRAIENYLTTDAIQEVKSEKYSSLDPYQKLSSASPCWAKEENWLIARRMNKDDLKDTDLGEFLEGLLK